jgi:MinD-like ATPase involved in chromosome partitioning or flagellar assembly
VTIVAVAGDVCTTTTVAIASAWPAADDVVVVEADPAGGDLAAWFDVPVAPSLSTVVTRITDASRPELERFVRTAPNGVRLVPAPARAPEANQAVGESARTLVPSLAAMRSPVAIVDTGAVQATPGMHPFVGAAGVTVVVHRQATQSARAAAVRLQRFADTLDSFASVAANVVVAVVGAVPFSLDEIQAFLVGSVGATPVVGLPVDPLTAGVYAGRTGVSPRRLARLPLARASRDLAATVERAIDHQTDGLWRVPT